MNAQAEKETLINQGKVYQEYNKVITKARSGWRTIQQAEALLAHERVKYADGKQPELYGLCNNEYVEAPEVTKEKDLLEHCQL